MKKKLFFAILLCLLTIVGCKKEKYTITVLSDTDGCLVSGGGTYESGTVISISAIPADGYIFKQWDDGNTSNPRTITVDYNGCFTAMFELSISAPTGLHAEQSNNRILLSWNTVTNAEKYYIYWSQTSSGNYQNLGYTEYTMVYDEYPVEGDNYYKVSAVNNNGQESSLSSYAYCYYSTGGGGGGGSAPNAPTNVSATTMGTTSSPYVKISWSSVSNATSYKVYRSSSSSGTYYQIGSSTSNTYLYDSDPLSGYNYYKVKAVNSYGESSYSSYDYVYISGGGGGGGSAPNAPTGVTATNTGTSSSPNVKISWSSVSNATSYKVYRSSSSSGTYNQIGSSTSNTYLYDSNPLSGYNYYKVTAVNSYGESSYSSYASFNNTGSGGGGGGSYSPCPPTVSVSGSTSQTVSWTVSTSSGCGTPSSFEVYKYDPCSSTWELKTTTTSHSYSCSSSNIHPGINRYGVKAINSMGSATNYGLSSEVSLSKPTSFSVQKQSGGYLKFTWSSVAKATGYQIFTSSTASGTYVILEQVDDGSQTTLTTYYPQTSGTRYFKIKAFYTCGTVGPIYSDLTTYQSVTF